ncbi:hypothetical protein [Deinococcus marmoris]|uniref:phage NrS-1 polymerase family protein n=1 Tax=Deinococcus marmoris TaxID=249408 RepID=UPI0012DEF239|nr:hypothetical protein [Deinococcus marmoris]
MRNRNHLAATHAFSGAVRGQPSGDGGHLPRPQDLEVTLPGEVLALPHWLPWVALPRDNGGLGKAPALPRAGRLAPVDCRGGGMPWQEALELARGHRAGGVGVGLPPSAGLVALDLDGPLTPERAERLERIDGYAETSPSGQGVHVWLRGTLPRSRREHHVEWLAQGFVTVTGRALKGRGRHLGHLEKAEAVLGTGNVPRQTQDTSTQGRRGLTVTDQEVLGCLRRARNGDRAMGLLFGSWEALGYASQSEADFAAARLLRFYTRDPAQIERLLRASALDRPKYNISNYLQRTITRALDLGGPVHHTGGEKR